MTSVSSTSRYELVLLGITATASFFVGQRSDALIIGVILGASVGHGIPTTWE